MKGQRLEQSIPHSSPNSLDKIILNSVKKKKNQSPYPEERFYFPHFSEGTSLPPAAKSDIVSTSPGFPFVSPA